MNDGSAATRYEGKYLKILAVDGWEYAERTKASGVVAVIATTRDKKLILTRQHRRPVGCDVIDLPAGLSGDGGDSETLQTAAERELFEETGYVAKSWKELVSVPTSPGLTSEVVTIFRAKQLKREGDGRGVDGEDITTVEVAVDDLRAWLKKQVKKGLMIDPKVYLAMEFI